MPQACDLALRPLRGHVSGLQWVLAHSTLGDHVGAMINGMSVEFVCASQVSANAWSLLAKPMDTLRRQLSPTIWTLEPQRNTGKKLNARSQATGRALTNMDKTQIDADIAKFQTLREERMDEQRDEREFEIKNYIHKVGMQMQRSLRKEFKQVNKQILDIVDAIDFKFKGQDVIVDGLRYVISEEMKLKDPERPGSTRKEYLLLLKTSVDNYNDLLSKSAGGDCARPAQEDINKGHKYILAAQMKELTALICQRGVTVVVVQNQ
jgi:hypothetical protein